MIKIDTTLLNVLSKSTNYHELNNQPLEKLDHLKKILETLTQEEQELINTTPDYIIILHLLLLEDNLKFERKINDQISVITEIYNPQLNSVNASYLIHNDTQTLFDLTYVDLYQHSHLNDSDDETYQNHISSYIYGDPKQEDWTHRRVTMFEDVIDQAELENEEI